MSESGRRLAAIMFADVAGYTSLSQRNESLALRLVDECREVVRPILAKHGGREVKTMGDGFLVEFPSALEAVRCAFVVQQAMRDLNGPKPLDEAASLRIGIHVGDVVHVAGDVMGDAVNIASRIEPQAKPGGICVSRQVYDQIRNKFEFPVLSVGERQLKGLDRPLEVFAVSLPWERPSDASAPSLDSKRLAVLPLENFSPDPGDEYFADGMTEELISTISRIRGLRVIARTSAMQYKGQRKRISEIGSELKAGSIIEGSVRKSADTVRITVQLIDASNEEHLWAEDYERKLENVFQIQHDIATRVAEGLKVKLLPEEQKVIGKEDTRNSEAFTLYLKGRYHWNARTKVELEKAAVYFQKAIEADPSYARAYCGLADTYSIMAFNNYMPSDEAYRKAKSLAERALEIDNTLAEAYTSLAFVGDDHYDWEKSESYYRRALELNPSYATAHFWYGIELMWRGKDELSIEQSRQAEELDPLSPAIAIALGQAFIYTRRYDQAVTHLEQKVRAEPEIPSLRFILGIAYFYGGMYQKAEAEERKALELGMGSNRALAVLGMALAKQGRDSEARELLSKLKDGGAPLALRAMFLIELGEAGAALDLVEEAFAAQESGLAWISVMPSFDPVRADPRFAKVITGMRLQRQ